MVKKIDDDIVSYVTIGVEKHGVGKKWIYCRIDVTERALLRAHWLALYVSPGVVTNHKHHGDCVESKLPLIYCIHNASMIHIVSAHFTTLYGNKHLL